MTSTLRSVHKFADLLVHIVHIQKHWKIHTLNPIQTLITDFSFAPCDLQDDKII